VVLTEGLINIDTWEEATERERGTDPGPRWFSAAHQL